MDTLKRLGKFRLSYKTDLRFEREKLELQGDTDLAKEYKPSFEGFMDWLSEQHFIS